MAHPKEKRTALRKSYVFDGLPLTTCAIKHKISVGTAQNWKNKAASAGDDWDKERDAFHISSMGLEDAAAQMLRSYIKHHNSTMLMLELPKDEGGIQDPMDRVKALATLSDSHSKLLASHAKHSPRLSRLATALEVLTHFADFLEKENPDLVKHFAPMIEAFGSELQKRYG